jgi:hypothetical protein
MDSAECCMKTVKTAAKNSEVVYFGKLKKNETKMFMTSYPYNFS